MIKNRVVVYTDKYKFEHEKSPRGYDNWFFICKGRMGKRYECNFEGMYKEAKEKAVEFACENECGEIYLLS